MTSKHFSIIFIAAVIIVIGNLLFSRLLSSNSLTPTASPNDLLFNQNEQQPNVQNQQQSLPNKKMSKQYPKFPGELPANQLKNKKAVIQTKKGIIEFEIYPEATKTASNFIFLTNDNFYDGLTFHRVEPGFVIQGGDPNGNGTGGPGYQFADEPVINSYDKGIVAMANSGPNTNGSQFFIMLDKRPELPPQYTIFGKVVKGQDVISAIRPGDVMDKVTVESF